jgi:hypothetical protein
VSIAPPILTAETRLRRVAERYQNAQIDVMNAYGMNGLTPVTIEALEYRIVVADSLLTAARQALIAAQQQMGASR